jgi:hypothetical protein
MKLNNYLLTAAVGLTALAASAQNDTVTYSFTGGVQTFTVPCGVTSMTVITFGAQGGAGANGAPTASQAGGAGALGGQSMATYAVTPGQVYNIFVGGMGATPTGGFNGGGNGGTQNAGGGGGASDVRFPGTAEADRIITAGGGGGGGRGGCESTLGAGGDGGVGGNGNGENGENSPTSGGDAGGGFGGVGATGGLAGIGCSGFLGSAGSNGAGGTGGAGGAGQACCCFSSGSIPGGGGGGGGQLGGGGGGGGSAGTAGCSGNDKGAGGGGAGGTSFTGTGTSAATLAGVRLGDGVIMVIYDDPTPSMTNITGNGSFCAGGMDTLTTPADPEASSYVWAADANLTIVSGQGTNTIEVTGNTAGTYTVTAIAVNAACTLSGPADTFMITVHANPVVTYSSAMDTVCWQDGSFALTGGSPSGGTYSGAAVSGGNFDPPSATPGSYSTFTYMYTDSNSCSGSTMDSIWVDLCTGMTTAQLNTISISPNPATDVVTLSWNSNATVTAIKVMDAAGRVVMTETTINGNTKRLDVTALPAGTYTISTVGSVTSVKTFVKK